MCERFPDAPTILDSLKSDQNIKYFRVWVKKGNACLSEEEFDNILDQSFVDWDSFRSNILQSIGENKATNRNNALKRSVKHMNRVTELKSMLSRQYFDGINTSKKKRDAFRSAVSTIASLFVSKLENSADCIEDDISKRIDELLAADWRPTSDTHSETLYYISGAMLHAAQAKSKQNNVSDELAYALKELYQMQSIDISEAEDSNLPFNRIKDREMALLTYPSNDFFQLVCKYESVIEPLLEMKEIKKYGPRILDLAMNVLSKRNLGVAALLSFISSEGDEFAVNQFCLSYLIKLRGKDWARKVNAQVVSDTETLRSSLGTKAAMAREKNKQNRENNSNTAEEKSLCRTQRVEYVPHWLSEHKANQLSR